MIKQTHKPIQSTKSNTNKPLEERGLRSQGVWIESGYTHQGTKSGRFSSGYHSSELSLSNPPKEVLP